MQPFLDVINKVLGFPIQLGSGVVMLIVMTGLAMIFSCRDDSTGPKH